jgi:hypothetical protein
VFLICRAECNLPTLPYQLSALPSLLQMALMAPKIGFGIVDVRDVAAAHCLAAFTPTAKGRHILAPNSVWITDLLAIIHKKYPQVGHDSRAPCKRRQR